MEDLRVAQAQLCPSFTPDDGVRVRSVRVGLAEGKRRLGAVEWLWSSTSGVFSLIVAPVLFTKPTLFEPPPRGCLSVPEEGSRRARAALVSLWSRVKDARDREGQGDRDTRIQACLFHTVARLYIPSSVNKRICGRIRGRTVWNSSFSRSSRCSGWYIIFFSFFSLFFLYAQDR